METIFYISNYLDRVNYAGKNNVLIKFLNKEITTRSIILQNKLSTNDIKYVLRDEFRELTHFTDDFLKGKDLNRYFIIPGLRGVGKTTILFQIYEYLLKEKNIPQNQILYLSCENLNERFKFKILDVVDCFLKYHHNSLLETADKKIFLLIDESQYDYNWALSGKSIYDATNNIFMIFTGSAALDFEYNADSARRLLKRTVNPLTYNQYLKLKYNFNASKMSEVLHEVIFQGKVDNAIDVEKTFVPQSYTIKGYLDNYLDNFIRYGGFSISFFEDDVNIVCERLNNVIRRVITKDIPRFGRISTDNLENAHRLLNFLALQKPGEISQNNISNYLDCSATTVKNILKILEDTHLLFHCEPYGSASTRYKKSWRYFFATSSLRHVLNQDLDNPIQD